MHVNNSDISLNILNQIRSIHTVPFYFFMILPTEVGVTLS
jgi:hypothetical protein